MVIYPRYWLAALKPSVYSAYQGRNVLQGRKSYKAMSDLIIKNSLVKIKKRPPYIGDMEGRGLLNSMARATYDPKTSEYSFKWFHHRCGCWSRWVQVYHVINHAEYRGYTNPCEFLSWREEISLGMDWPTYLHDIVYLSMILSLPVLRLPDYIRWFQPLLIVAAATSWLSFYLKDHQLVFYLFQYNLYKKAGPTFWSWELWLENVTKAACDVRQKHEYLAVAIDSASPTNFLCVLI